MYTNDTYKSLVIAGAKIVEDIKEIEKADIADVEIVYENGVKLYDAFKCLVNVAGDFTTGDDVARICYADAVSVYAYNTEIGERYLELLLKVFSDDKNAVEELQELSKTIPEDEHYWVRRNL